MIIRTLNENHAGREFTAYEPVEDDDGLYICRLSDAATLHVKSVGKAIELVNRLTDDDVIAGGPAAVDDILRKVRGTWEAPEQCQRLPARDLGLLIFHA